MSPPYSQPIIIIFLLLSSLPFLFSTYVGNPEAVAEDVIRSIENSTIEARRRHLLPRRCTSGNPIDDCWRCDPNWEKNRKRLADCALGFGRKAIGGRNGEFYIVNTSRDDDDYRNPTPGTLRYGLRQKRPLWIIFERNMSFKLKRHLIIESDKTIDGRGVTVRISDGPCLVVRFANNIIIHGLHIYNCKKRFVDGDGIQIFRGSNIWVDHNYMSNCEDGLIDAVFGSTNITISNNYFTHHDHTILLGHSDSFTMDKKMHVTVAFNHFGKGLIQRMPRCRFGFFHVVNNDYTRWEMYAIGGSAGATIFSQGNKFVAPNHRFHKKVTMRPNTPKSVWKHWNWMSSGDEFHNGAYFVDSGSKSQSSYEKAWSLTPKLSSLVGTITKEAGVLKCRKGSPCWVRL